MTNSRVTGVRSVELGVRDLHQSADFYTKVWALEEVPSEADCNASKQPRIVGTRLFAMATPRLRHHRQVCERQRARALSPVPRRRVSRVISRSLCSETSGRAR